VQGQLGQFLVGQGQRIGEHGGARFQARIEQRGQQGNAQHRQGGDQDQVVQALAIQAVDGRAAETAIGETRRRHAGVMHADDGNPHHHRRTATDQAHIGVCAQAEGDPQRRTGGATAISNEAPNSVGS
jgi:hypothetical protein